MTVCFQGLEIVKEHFNLVANSLDITAMPNIDGSMAKLAVISLSLEDIMTITWTENLNPGKKKCTSLFTSNNTKTRQSMQWTRDILFNEN